MHTCCEWQSIKRWLVAALLRRELARSKEEAGGTWAGVAAACGALIRVLDKPHLDQTTPIGLGFIAFLSAPALPAKPAIVIHNCGCRFSPSRTSAVSPSNGLTARRGDARGQCSRR